MKITLYAAISADGFLAKTDGDTEWISDSITDDFNQTIARAGCFVVGRRSFEQYYGELYPPTKVLNLVLTQTPIVSQDPNVIYVTSPYEAIKIAKQHKHKQLFVVGGGITNGLFLKENLIDDMFLVVHPLILGSGIKLFERVTGQTNLQLLESKMLSDGLTQLHYRVII